MFGDQMNLGNPIAVWVLRHPTGIFRPIATADELRWCVRWIRRMGSARLRLRVIR